MWSKVWQIISWPDSVLFSGAAVGQVRAITQQTPPRETKRSVHTPLSSWWWRRRGHCRKKHDNDLMVSHHPIREELQEPLFITDYNFWMEDPVGFIFFSCLGLVCLFINKLCLILLIDLLKAKKNYWLGPRFGLRTKDEELLLVRVWSFYGLEKVKKWRWNEGGKRDEVGKVLKVKEKVLRCEGWIVQVVVMWLKRGSVSVCCV